MAKLQLFKIVLVILAALCVCAYAQNQGNKKQKVQHQNQQQHHQQPHHQQQGAGRPQQKPRPKPAAQPQKNKLPNKEKVTPVQKHKYITKHIPDLGRVRGRTFKTTWSGKTIIQFLDIPYGQSPIGPLRFKPSLPAEPWQNVLDASKAHPGCPSLQDMHKYENMEKKSIDFEDCLRLTVNSKSLIGKAPVMVYIHGDFLYDGNSMEAAPGYLLEEDVVLVSLRYRLGPFGFLSTMSEDMPGNAAVHDVILALKWIQKNIASFGGDPGRVTLFGQVGGSALINVLTMSPAVPDGLFHRVIYQSGSALSPAFITETPIAAAKDIAKFAGCKNPNKVEAINKCFRKLNTTALLSAFSAHGDAKATLGVGSYGGVQFVIGGPSGVLPQHPGKLLAAESFKPYPSLGGSVKNAGTFILKDIYIDNFNETIIDDKLDGMGYIDHIIKQTNGADPTGAWTKYAKEEIFSADDIKNGTFYRLVPGLIDLCSTIPFKNPVLLALQANAKKMPKNTFLYSFDYEGELNRYSTNEDDEGSVPFELGVSLTDDNLYLFPWPRHTTLNLNRDIKVAKRMVALWTSFAATGVPKAPGVPAWPPMSQDTGPYIKIGKSVTIGDNYLDEYNVAVKEAKTGYNLVNEDYFESLVEITEEDKDVEEGEEVEEDYDEEDESGRAHGGLVPSIPIIARRGST